MDKMVRKLNFMQIGNKYFDRQNMERLDHHGITLLSGFSAIVGLYQSGAFLKIDMNHRVLSQKNVLDEMSEIREYCREDFRERISEFLEGKIVLTTYNYRCFRVDRVAFDLSPMTQFTRSTNRGRKGGKGAKPEQEQEE